MADEPEREPIRVAADRRPESTGPAGREQRGISDRAPAGWSEAIKHDRSHSDALNAIEARFGDAPPPATQDLLTRAITASDNAAAEQLWATLGPPDVAGATVQRVLASTGDASTSVETRVLRPGYTSFGQTVWPLASQGRFIAGLPCLEKVHDALQPLSELFARAGQRLDEFAAVPIEQIGDAIHAPTDR